MEVRIQSVKFDADVKLTNYVQKKVEKLDRFFDGIIAAEVVLSLMPDLNNKKAAIRLEIPGYDLRAERQAKKFESAVVACVDVLKQQLKKTKEKIRGL
ncbi:MAG: ribosome-associated translation inhibitor RaiA [Prevotellaceae bacterium]|jgi:putative sigma-54 modulation protein|nr:ribosome-associated translation inhibitor RaiA [Prevotellaceae bacterium]